MTFSSRDKKFDTRINRLIGNLWWFPFLFFVSTVALEGELTSVRISQNSRYALINLAPDVRITSD